MLMLNLTQHKATREQIEGGVVDLPAEIAGRVSVLLTFDNPPEGYEMVRRAEAIAKIVSEVREMKDFQTPGVFSGVPMKIRPRSVMIGGAPFFMSTLEAVLIEERYFPYYAFSRRESVEERTADGGVRKVATFRHVGFVVACPPDPVEPGQN